MFDNNWKTPFVVKFQIIDKQYCLSNISVSYLCNKLHILSSTFSITIEIKPILKEDVHTKLCCYIFFSGALQPKSGLGRLIVAVFRSHTPTHTHTPINTHAHTHPHTQPHTHRPHTHAHTHTHKHTQNHTHTHTWWDSSAQVISSSRRPLPTQQTTNTRNETPCPQRDSKPAMPAVELPQTYAFDCTTTGIGCSSIAFY